MLKLGPLSKAKLTRVPHTFFRECIRRMDFHPEKFEAAAQELEDYLLANNFLSKLTHVGAWDVPLEYGALAQAMLGLVRLAKALYKEGAHQPAMTALRLLKDHYLE